MFCVAISYFLSTFVICLFFCARRWPGFNMARIVKDKVKRWRCRGYGFVSFATEEVMSPSPCLPSPRRVRCLSSRLSCIKSRLFTVLR